MQLQECQTIETAVTQSENIGKPWTTIFYNLVRALDFTYPYHQVIGFYLEKAGYAESEYSLFYKEIQFDFYITYNIKNKVFDTWRVWIPSKLRIEKGYKITNFKLRITGFNRNS